MTDTDSIVSPSPAACATANLYADIGSPGAWARDFAILGALSTAFGLMALGVGPFLGGVVGLGAVIGAGTGAALGWVLPGLLARHGHGLPGALLAALGPIVGGAWGALVGVITAVCFMPDGELIAFAATFGAVAGAAQVAWFWVAYLALRVRRGPVWPVLLLAGVTPFLGGQLMHMVHGGGGWGLR